MKDSRHFMPEVCPETSETVQTVSLEVDPNHPLLQLKRALPWDALCQVRTFHWRQAGKNVDGGPGLSWEVSFYGHLVVLMLVKQLNAREMEAYLAENVVARVFIGRSVAPSPQMRDHANIARAYMALGQEGLDAVGALIIKSATGLGFADPTILSSDMTAQELPHWLPERTGYLAGSGAALWPCLEPTPRPRGTGCGVSTRSGANDCAHGQRTPPVCQGPRGKASVVEPFASGGRTVGGANMSYDRTLWSKPRPGHPQGHGDALRHGRGGSGADPANHSVAHHERGGQGQNSACRHSPGPLDCAKQSGQEGGVWLALSAEPTRWRVCVWTLDPRGDRRTQDALGSLGTVPRDMGRRGDARVGGLRSGGRCYNHPQPLGPRGGEAHGHSAQGAAALASCRGSPAAGAKRAGQDRRGHWHVEKQQIWVQQTQGTSLADAGDGGSEVYRIVQLEQIDARFGSVENVRQNGIGRIFPRLLGRLPRITLSNHWT